VGDKSRGDAVSKKSGARSQHESANFSRACPPSFSTHTMATRTERFQKKPRDPKDKSGNSVAEPEEVLKFSPEEEAVSCLSAFQIL
jgi:hypothetical protein